MYSLITLLIICNFCFYSSGASSAIDDWYWRGYTHLIPQDALATGVSSKGETTYLGQIVVASDFTPKKYGALPATVKAGERFAYGSYNGHISNSTHNVKVFCTRSPERYFWFKPTDSIPVGCKYVIVGDEGAFVLNAGRIAINNEIVIGKIIATNNGKTFPVMYYPYDGTEKTTYEYRALFHCEN